MSLRTHHYAVRVAPRYGTPHGDARKRPASTFTRSFRRARCAPVRRAAIDVTPEHGAPQRHAWPTAFAVMLVANLVAPAAAAVPKGLKDVRPDTMRSDHLNVPLAQRHLPDRTPLAVDVEVFQDVFIRPVPHFPIKTDYTPVALLKSLAAGRAPFLKTGEQVLNAYTIVTGHEVASDVRRTVRDWTGAADTITGLVPDVQMLRLPSDVLDMTADAIKGHIPSGDRLAGPIQIASPRGAAWRPHQGPVVARHPEPMVKIHEALIPSSPAFRSSALHPLESVRVKFRPSEVVPGEAPAPIPENERIPSSHRLADPLAEEKSAPRFEILGEFKHLVDYAQPLPNDELPRDKTTRLFFVRGQRYLRGEAGYYRITPGLSGDHWLIDAPRQTRAQVPVTYDPVMRRWRAHSPLRLCGGGCGASQPMTLDSIAGSYLDIFAATEHIPDKTAQEAIQNSFADLSRMYLIRSNRADLRTLRDNSIIDHRAALYNAMRHIDRRLPLDKQQRLAARATATYYFSHPHAEAFCQENSEILLHFLLQDGISLKQLRMITVQPKNKPPHVMVLYTESPPLIELLDASTPNPRMSPQPDGITSAQLALEAYMTRESTLLLDPWSRRKAVSFASAKTPEDAVDILDAAFVDIGHTPGNPCIVSVTRPLTARRGTLSHRDSLGSIGSSGTASGTSGTSGTSGSISSNNAGPERT